MIHHTKFKDFYVANNLYKQMIKFHVKRLKKKDNNRLFLVVGDTGIGKSAFANQMASIVDPDFTEKNIQFTNAQMIEGLRTLHNKSVIFDEAFRGASGRNVMSKDQKKILEMFYEIRQLNQCVFLCAPSFFRLDEAIAVELSDAMFHIYKSKNGRRGFRMFNKKKKYHLYYKGKRMGKSYTLVPSMFNGNFPNTYVVDEKIYRKRKFDSLYGEEAIPESKIDTQMRKERDVAVQSLRDVTGSIRNAVKAMDEHGGGLKKSRVQEICAQNP